MKRSLLVVMGILMPASIHLAARLYAQEAAQAKPAMRPAAVLKAAEDLKWVDVPNVKGVQQAVLWGNPQKGPNGLFNKFAAGTEVPLHSHTANFRSVVVAGTMVFGLEGQSPKELGPGSYSFLPGGVKHTTACKAGADCVIFTAASGPFDVVPAEGAKP